MKDNGFNKKQERSIQKCHKCGKLIELDIENGKVHFHHCELGSM
jgi:ssDNA-binding Zn-finger/Zn-ribbon topoisomerase 1